MARSFKTQLAGQIGEALVVAELGRRGIVATAFAGNVPDIDLLAYKDGQTCALQVKAWRNGSVSFDATRYLNIDISNDIQSVTGLNDELDPDLVFVFVMIGEKLGDDRFFLLSQRNLQLLMEQGYTSFLAKHDGKRPRNAQTTHNSVTLEQLARFEDDWALIEKRFC
ncbi:hypothetical protein ABIE62_002195 [Porphyrobacter sp. MBR-155]|jgi:hypothetical protein|uniref:hypothetical protein n=1 Tax=Porphyrobacter sp. MBR-155 TaxID=3156464 RepID=UPI003395AF40